MMPSCLSRFFLLSLPFAALCLTGCEATPAPDYRIRLVPSIKESGSVAVPPDCPSWTTTALGDNENTITPQLGCAAARNLAAQVERPEDLIAEKTLGKADGTLAAASMNNYRAGKTRALIDAKAEAPTQQEPASAQAAP